MEEEKSFCNNCKRNISASNFATHSAYCERNIKVCKLCNEPLPILEEDKHLNELHIDVQCEQCQLTLEKWMLPEHLASCHMRPVTCEFCDGEFPFAEFSEHCDFCSSRTEKCLLCKKYVMLKEKQKHSEMHQSEKKIRHENVVNEIEENILNEVLINSTASETNIQNEVGESKTIPSCSNRVMIEEIDDTNLRSTTSMGAATNVYENSKQMSKRYGTCCICKQSILWIDMNTHTAGCAAISGLLFDESVSKQEATNRTEYSYVTKEDLEDHSIVACQYCKQECSEDRIEEHTRNCPENSSYECSLCTKTVAEKDKVKHESFECQMLLGFYKPDSPKMSSNASRRSSGETKPQNSSKVSIGSKDKFTLQKRKHEREISEDHYPELSRNKSYADSARTSREIYKSSLKSDICQLCYKKISERNMQDHLVHCQALQKRKCLYCSEKIFITEEDAHLSTCNTFNSQTVYQNCKNGAVPKRSSFAMVKPETAKCRFCQTELSSDIIDFHEEKCKHLLRCEKCDVSFPHRDFKTHTCNSKYKERKEKQDKNEGMVASKGGLKSFMWNIFNKSPMNEGNAITRSMEYSSNASTSHDYYDNQFTEEIQIPCEFCSKLFAASDIVLHETGCQPDLVSFAKKDSQEDRESKVPFFSSPSNKCSKGTSCAEKFFSVEKKQDFPSTKRNSKMDTESNVKPGEFLKSFYGTKISFSSKTETDKEYNPNEFGDNINSHASEIQSVWNVTMAADENKDKGKISPTSEEHVLVVDECTANSDAEMEEMLEFINEGNTTNAIAEKKYNSKEIEESTSHLTLDHAFYPEKCDRDIPKDENILNTKSPCHLYREALKAFKEVNDNLDETVPEDLSTNFASGTETNVQCQKRLTIEPDEDILRKKEFLTTKENLFKHYAENKDDDDDDDALMQYQDSVCENNKEDLKRWAKWQSEGSSNS